jgi:hypothetical protein
LASAFLMRTFSSENNYTLVCGDLYVYLRAGIEPILRRSISPAEPLWCLIGAITITRGRECRERPKKTLFVLLLGEPR